MSLRVLLLIAFALAWPLAGVAQEEMESQTEESAAEEAAPEEAPSEEAAPEEAAPEETAGEESAAPESMVEEQQNLATRVLLYLPNRVFDLMDVVRLRGRVGPGFALGARATRPASLFLGGYASVGVGLPGPRGEPKLPLPLGFDSAGGMQVSMVGDAPNGYGRTEVGALLHVILVGLDVGVDPGEVLDFAAGFLLMDPRGDDF